MAKRDAENLLAYPILVALTHGPRTTRELSHKLLMSAQAVRNRCRELEDEGHIVQRASDHRWVLRVQLRAEGIPELVNIPAAGQPVTIRAGKAEGPVVLGPRSPNAGRGELDPPTDPPQKSGLPGGVLALAARFGVPGELDGLGRLRAGVRGECIDCRATTRLWWGITPICQSCAKMWVAKESVRDKARGDHQPAAGDLPDGAGAGGGTGGVREDGGGEGPGHREG